MTDTRDAASGGPATEAVEVRRVTPADDPLAMRRLRLEMLADTPVAFIERLSDAQRRSADYWRARLTRYTTDPDRVLFVAEAGGTWLGQGGGYVDAEGRAHLVSVYVTPRLRGSGLVDRLADRVLAWARERGCPDVRLEVAEVNSRALAAYRRLGFRATGRSQPHPLYPEQGRELEMVRAL